MICMYTGNDGNVLEIIFHVFTHKVLITPITYNIQEIWRVNLHKRKNTAASNRRPQDAPPSSAAAEIAFFSESLIDFCCEVKME